MNGTSTFAYKNITDPYRDTDRESYWADFRTEVGTAPGYGFPPELEKDARAGDFRAQNNLAVQFYLGRDRDKDYEKAVCWFKKAAEKGFVVAQNNLGYMYQQGRGIEPDETLAFEWYLKAAEQGYGMAQYRVSQCCGSGSGTAYDIKDEFRWLKKSVDTGNPLAQYILGKFSTEEILLKEIFGDSDDPEGRIKQKINWLVSAAVQGYAPAQVKLGNYYQHGYGLKKDLKKAIDWYSKAAGQGYRRGQYYLGNCYYNGIGTEKNPGEAVKWLRRAAEKGDRDAQYNLGLFYHDDGDGQAGSKRLMEAAEWYLKAARQGSADALYQLIRLSRLHPELLEDFRVSVPLFRKAAEQGNADAMYQLGLIYDRGLKTETGDTRREARDWIRKAAERGNVDAMFHLGQPFELGVKEEEVIKWYCEAAEHGHEKACFTLGRAYLHGCCHGIKISRDPNKAFRYLAKASARKKSHIIGELAVCYLYGFGVQRNLSFVVDIFKSLAIRKYEIPPISIIAKMALAKMYLAGEGVRRNEDDALHFLYTITDFRPYFSSPQLYRFEGCLKLSDNDLFQWLAENATIGEERSQAVLGLYYFCRQDFPRAGKWLRLAADRGDEKAIKTLAEMQGTGSQ